MLSHREGAREAEEEAEEERGRSAYVIAAL